VPFGTSSVPVTWVPSTTTGDWVVYGNTFTSSTTSAYYVPTTWSSTAGTINADQSWEPTDEERARQRRQRQEERQRARAAVNDRALALLMSVLDEVQAEAYRRDQTFEVVGSHGGLYRIRPGIMANVDALNPTTREFIGRLCAHPREYDANGDLPEADLALGQLLDLTSDEPGFVRDANVHRGRRPQVPVLAA
jgi:hypothetical protein